MSLKICLVVGALTAASAISPAFAQATPPTSTMPATEAHLSSAQFARKAAITGMYEIAAAKVAQKRSHDRAIDRFAAQMIRDHTQNAAKLKSVAASVGGIPLPTSLDEQHKGFVEQLKSVDAKQFATTYAQQQIQGHRDAIALFTSYSRHGASPKLRHYASASLPVLDRHLAMAQALPTGPRVAGGR